MSKDDYYITKDSVLKISNNTITVITKEEKVVIPIERVDSIYFIGSGSITTGVIKKLKEYGIILHIYGKYGEYLGTFYPKEKHISGDLTIRQANAYLNHSERMNLAKKFIRGSMKNIERVVSRFKLGVINPKDIDRISTVKQLMQKEGQFRREFYKLIDNRLSPDYKINKRSRRPPTNRGNAILSFLNSLVYNLVSKEVYYTHLNPSISYLHEPFERRYSLALDVSEIFKPLISEWLLLKLINLKIIKKDVDFEDKNGIFLSKQGRKKVIEHFEEHITNRIKMKRSNKTTSIKELIRIELYKLEKHLLNIKEYKPLVMWW